MAQERNFNKGELEIIYFHYYCFFLGGGHILAVTNKQTDPRKFAKNII